MSTAITSFKTHILPDIPGVPDPMLESEIIKTISEFCTKAWVLKKTMYFEVTSSNIDDTNNDAVDIDISSTGLTPVSVVYLNIDNTKYDVERRDFQNDLTNYSYIRVDDVKYFDFPDLDTVRMFDMTTSDLILQIVYKPKLTATTVPDKIYNEWVDVIAAGVKYRLCKMPNKLWSDSKAAQTYYIDWRRGLSEAKAQVNRGFAANSNVVQPREFGY